MFPSLDVQLWPCLAALIAGLVFQSLLPSSIRMFLIYPLSFTLGFASNYFSNFLPFFFDLGMSLRAAIGQYWMCFMLEISLLIAGFAVAFLV